MINQSTIDEVNQALESFYKHIQVVKSEDGWKIQEESFGRVTFAYGFRGEECSSLEDILFRLFTMAYEMGYENG